MKLDICEKCEHHKSYEPDDYYTTGVFYVFSYCTLHNACCSYIKNCDALVNNLTMKQPAADVVEVVRCKDCKHAKFYACKNDPCYKSVLCDLNFTDGDEFFYCSYGERKDNENE